MHRVGGDVEAGDGIADARDIGLAYHPEAVDHADITFVASDGDIAV